MPVGPGRNPDWFHQTIKVQIGKIEYVFQTLSLFDVWMLWPHLAPIKRALERGKPLDFTDHVIAILELLNPVLAARLNDPEDEIKRDFNSSHIDLLINFYERQDWGRIVALTAKTTAVEAEESGADPDEAHQTFVLLCSAAARHCNMAMTDFVKQRFEFCADQLIALHHSAEKAREDADDGRPRSWREATMRFAAAFGVKPVFVPEDKQPEFMRVLNKHRVN